MKTPPWTPGEWLADEGDVFSEAAIGGNIVCLSPGEDCPESVAYWPANARLIAAAPALAEVVAEFVAAWDGEGKYDEAALWELVEPARAALSAAGWPEGGEG